jgi:hypothetical protein
VAESTSAYVALIERQTLGRVLDADDRGRLLSREGERALVVEDMASEATCAGKLGDPHVGGHARSVLPDPAASMQVGACSRPGPGVAHGH